MPLARQKPNPSGMVGTLKNRPGFRRRRGDFPILIGIRGIPLHYLTILGYKGDQIGGRHRQCGMQVKGRLVRPFIAKHAVAIGSQTAAIGVDPQGPLRIGIKCLDPWLGQFRRVCRILDHKSRAVKPGQAIVGAHPEIAVRRLGHGSHGAAGQIIFRVPAVHQIICRSRRREARPHQQRQRAGRSKQSAEVHGWIRMRNQCGTSGRKTQLRNAAGDRLTCNTARQVCAVAGSFRHSAPSRIRATGSNSICSGNFSASHWA